MRVHLFNFLLLLTVAGCLFITLSQSAPEAQTSARILPSFITLTPSATPHPLDAYQEKRAAQRSKEQESLALLAQSNDPSLQTAAEKALLSLQEKAEKERQAEGLLLGMGYERALCILQETELMIFASPALSDAHQQIIFQSAAEICGILPQQVHLMAP